MKARVDREIDRGLGVDGVKSATIEDDARVWAGGALWQ